MEELQSSFENTFWKHYTKRALDDENKASGTRKIRHVYAPDEFARQACEWVTEKIQRAFKQSFLTNWGKSPIQTILDHIYTFRNGMTPRYWYIVDISSAFPSTTWECLVKTVPLEVMVSAGIDEETLKSFCFTPQSEGMCLPQGAPSSNALFHAFMSVIDRELEKLLKPWGIIYTRYCDDLIFTSMFPITGFKRKQILGVIRSHGLSESSKKTRSFDILKQVIECFGYTIRKEKATQIKATKTLISIRKGYLAHLRGYLFSMKQKGELLQEKDFKSKIGMFRGLEYVKLRYGLPFTQTERKIQEQINNLKDQFRSNRFEKYLAAPKHVPGRYSSSRQTYRNLARKRNLGSFEQDLDF